MLRVGVLLIDGVRVDVFVIEAVRVIVLLTDAEGIPDLVIVLLTEGLRVIVLLTDAEGVPDFVIVLLTEGLRVTVLLTDAEGVTDRVTEGETVPDFVTVLLTDAEGVRDLVVEAVTEDDRVVVRVTEGEAVTDRVADVERLGVRLFEKSEGMRVGSLEGSVGSAVDGMAVKSVGNSVAGSSVGMLGSSVIYFTICETRLSGMLGYSVFGSSVRVGRGGSDGSSVAGSSRYDGNAVVGSSIPVGISVGSVGISGWMLGNSVAKAVARSPGIVGNAVAAGRESVGSIEGRMAIRDLANAGTEGRAVNVRVGNGVPAAAPDARMDCEGRILMDGSVKPNCRFRLAAKAVAAAAIIVKIISNCSY